MFVYRNDCDQIIISCVHVCDLGYADTEKDLNHILSTFVDFEDETNNFSTSNYVSMADIQSILQTRQSDFVIATLNIQSINANLTISIQLWIIWLHLANISALVVFMRLGWHLTLTWHYLKYLVINWYNKVRGIPDMAVWSYTCMIDIAMKWEIYTATPTYGKVCLLMSPDIICVSG